VLAGISKVSIPPEQLDITDAEESLVTTINVKSYLPATVRMADSNFNGRVTATVYVEPKVEKTLTIPVENISISDIPEGFEWEYDENVTSGRMKIAGLNAVVSGVQSDELHGTVNIAEWMRENDIKLLKPGAYRVPMTVEVQEDIEVTEEAFVQIIISEVKEEEV
jgi:hypothetical protein